MVQTVLTIQRMRSMFINIHFGSSREMRKLHWHVKHYKHSSKRSKTQVTVHQREKMKKKKRNSWGQWRGKSILKSTIFISGTRMTFSSPTPHFRSEWPSETSCWIQMRSKKSSRGQKTRQPLSSSSSWKTWVSTGIPWVKCLSLPLFTISRMT